jgi:1-deoxy-D-xylulose-5-phosphate synthase
MVVMAPKDESELRDMLYTATIYDKGPIALRYPRGNGVGVPLKPGFDAIPIGKGEILRSGHDVALLAVGAMVQIALKAAEVLEKEGVTSEVMNMRFIKPIDGALLEYVATRFNRVMTLEDNVAAGGFGGAVAEYYASKNISLHLKIHGIPDKFIEHGSPAELQQELQLDAPGVVSLVKEFVRATPRQQSYPVEALVK